MRSAKKRLSSTRASATSLAQSTADLAKTIGAVDRTDGHAASDSVTHCELRRNARAICLFFERAEFNGIVVGFSAYSPGRSQEEADRCPGTLLKGAKNHSKARLAQSDIIDCELMHEGAPHFRCEIRGLSDVGVPATLNFMA